MSGDDKMSSEAPRQFSGSMTMAYGTRRTMTPEEAESLWKRIELETAARAARLPDEAACLAAMLDAFERLKELGWSEAMYCPKDGTPFQAIEAGSTGIHHCHYMGEWPTGSWWISADGDLWPSDPILFKLYPASADLMGG